MTLKGNTNQERPESYLTSRLIEIIKDMPPDQKKNLLDQLEQKGYSNKRKHPRYNFFEQAELQGIPQRQTDFIKDISIGGMFLETDLPFDLNQDIHLVLRLSGIKDPIKITGRVVRKAEKGVGIQFTETDSRILEVTKKEEVSKLKNFERGLSESLKVYLQERMSSRLYRKALFLKWKVRQVLAPFRKIRYYGHTHYCPVCKSHLSHFILSIADLQENARCPVCRCLERHRLDWVFLNTKTNLFDGRPKKMLHVAPEAIFELKFRKISGLIYITADLNNPRVMCNLDITEIPFADHSFDVIYCSHVLEHVPNDRKALRELYRVLKPGGWALLQVPITAKKTFEDPTIEDPFERKRLFGQIDHVRRYGPDYRERLVEAGFKTTVFSAGEILKNKNDFFRLGIQDWRLIFYCEK